MANPQPDKFIRISTEFFEALCFIKLGGETRQIFDFIIRKTWGYNKSGDYITTSQFSNGTGIARRSVIRAKNILLNKNMIKIIKGKGRTASFYQIQKDYQKWVVSANLTPLIEVADLRTQKIRGVKSAANSVRSFDTLEVADLTPTINKKTIDNSILSKNNKKPDLNKEFNSLIKIMYPKNNKVTIKNILLYMGFNSKEIDQAFIDFDNNRNNQES